MWLKRQKKNEIIKKLFVRKEKIMKGKIILAILISGLILAACQPVSPTANPVQNPTETTVNTAEPTLVNTEANPVTVRVAVLPLIDTLPMLVADQEGFFSNHGVKVEFIPVASAPERDQLIQAGQADATVNELLSDMFFNKDGIKMEVVRFAHKASATSAHFFILSSKASGIMDVKNLKGVEIGISQGTIIEYVMDKLLQANGFTSDDIKTVSVPKMPDRMALLASGELKAAVLPDPLAGLAVQQGAVIVFDDKNYPDYGASVISFTKDFIDHNPETVKGFLAAIEEATTLLNSNPAQFASLLSDKKLVPPPLLGSYVIPTFPVAGVPSEADWNDALSWAKDKGLLTVDVAYGGSVNDSFLP